MFPWTVTSEISVGEARNLVTIYKGVQDFYTEGFYKIFPELNNGWTYVPELVFLNDVCVWDIYHLFIYLFIYRFFHMKKCFKYFVASLCHSPTNSGCHVSVMSDDERLSAPKFSSCIPVWKNCHILHMYKMEWLPPLLGISWIVRRIDKIPCW
jgi:hypothetical protein